MTEAQQPVILVFDDNPSRAASNAAALASAGARVWYTTSVAGATGPQYDRFGDEPFFPPHFDFVLAHQSNEAAFKEAKTVASGEPPCYYSGGGPCDRGIKKRAITVNSPLTLDESRELVEWLQRSKGGSLPSILRPPEWLDTLPALCILCQGFLAMQVGAKDPEGKVAAALKAMGWGDILMEQLGDVSGLRAKVVEPAFWNVFPVDQKGRPDVQAVLTAAQTEWGGSGPGDFGPVRDLIRNLGTRMDSAVLVAEAYTQLAKRLGAT